MDKHISEYLLNKKHPKHEVLDFVNTTFKDTKLFIDPVLIEVGNSNFCSKAQNVVSDFFKELYKVYYNDNDYFRKHYLLKHAQEINDSHLGYGYKYGHGNTDEGLLKIFEGIENYITSIKIRHFYELSLCIPNFAEDGMSDLLTNILYKELSEFTIKQCNKFGVKTKTIPVERFYWDMEKHEWKKYCGESLVISGVPFLLIPKEIVQTHYRFTTDNFLRSVIVENICEETAIYNSDNKKIRQPKDKVREKLIRENGTVFNTVKNYAIKNQSLLNQYNKIVIEKYKSLTLDDEELDNIMYY